MQARNLSWSFMLDKQTDRLDNSTHPEVAYADFFFRPAHKFLEFRILCCTSAVD